VKNYQQPLDITIGENERVYFVVSGTHAIHLTGNYVVDPSEDDEEDDEDDYDLPPDMEDVLNGDDSELSDELDELADMERVKEIDTDEEEAPKLVESGKKGDKKGKKRTAEDAAENLDEMIAKDETKLSKKQQKKLKNNKGEAVAAEEKKDGAKTDKKVQFAKNLEQGPTSSAEKAKTAEKNATGVKVVNGVTIDDRKLGSGRTAKNGDKVSMRYIGKLTNGKVFDANKKGTPFSFKLGKGEVIKGWDIGIAGMSVGGERRLTIPAHLAYGSRSMPEIPANSTLVFDVKLLEIK
jgi:FK506-binding nuclear protein